IHAAHRRLLTFVNTSITFGKTTWLDRGTPIRKSRLASYTRNPAAGVGVRRSGTLVVGCCARRTTEMVASFRSGRHRKCRNTMQGRSCVQWTVASTLIEERDEGA